MPKISKKTIKLIVNGLAFYQDIDLMYNADHGFYSVVPAEYDATFDLIYDDEKKREKFSLSKASKGYDRSKRIINASLETELIESLKTFFEYCKTSIAKSRPVICVFFKSDKEEREDGDLKGLKFDDLEMSFGFCYAMEESIGGAKPHYNMVYKQSAYWADKEDRIVRQEVSFHYNWRANKQEKLILDDTPENRLFLEELYRAYSTLRTKLSGFMRSKKSLLDLIESKQKLLPEK
jgi:hypothetical protein